MLQRELGEEKGENNTTSPRSSGWEQRQGCRLEEENHRGEQKLCRREDKKHILACIFLWKGTGRAD